MASLMGGSNARLRSKAKMVRLVWYDSEVSNVRADRMTVHTFNRDLHAT